MPSDSEFAIALRAIVIAMVEASQGRLRLVDGEHDFTDDQCPTAGEFLKLDGSRLGRDIDLYVRIGDLFPDKLGIGMSLIDIAAEILIPIRHELPESFDAVAAPLAALGCAEISDPVQLNTWNAFFDDVEVRPTFH